MDRNNRLTIPPSLLVVIEDVGWWSGRDESLSNGPYRTGMGRPHGPEDYEAIAFLGKRLGTRILCGMVFCEWDRKNLLRRTPTATWLGASWDNPFRYSPLLDQAAKVINGHSEFIEIGFHGVGHEFWENGVVSRAEFHDIHGNMRGRADIIAHFEAFYELLKQSGIEAQTPNIFIPPALKHSFGNGEKGFQKILSDFEIRFVLTVFEKAKQHAPPVYDHFTRECGVTLIERGLSPVQWNQTASGPVFAFGWPILPLHWGNILHNDPMENLSVTEKWVNFIRQGAKKNGLLFLPTISETLTQIIYSRLAELKPIQNGFEIHLEKVRAVLPFEQDAGFYVQASKGRDRIRQIHGGKMIDVKYETGRTNLRIKAQGNDAIQLLFTKTDTPTQSV